MGRSSLWSISWLRHQMFYPYVTISAAQDHDSDDVWLSSFLGAQRILGYVRPRRIVVVHPPKTGKRRPHLWAAFGGAFELRTAFAGHCDVIGLQMHLRRMQTLNWDTANIYGQKFDEDRRDDSYFFTYESCILGRMGLVWQLASSLLW